MQRTKFIKKIQGRFEVNSVVALVGPRQCGKTTIAKQFSELETGSCSYFDLENPEHLAVLEEPMLALKNLEGLIVIDEVQRSPHLFPVLRVLVDQHKPRRFLILGSASRDLIQKSSETLAGRLSYIECTPFSLDEVENSGKLLHQGGFPPAYLNPEILSYQWRLDYISTFLERDIPQLGFRVPARSMRKFWLMLTHYHGQVFNVSEMSKALGVSNTSVKHYLNILVGTFMIRELTPWFANVKKRQVKLPKIYFRDSGIYLSLLGVKSSSELRMHPKIGACWEGFAMEQVIAAHQIPEEHCFFWGVHQQMELDLFLNLDGKKVGFEFKYQDAPLMSRSMGNLVRFLELDQLFVVYPGESSYPLAEKILAVSLDEYLKELGGVGFYSG